MKKLFLVMLAGVFFVSCSKSDISAPHIENTVFYKDANVAVSDFFVKQDGSQSANINFSTLYEDDVSKIELMSSADANTFCSMYVVNVSENSNITKNYSAEDNGIKAKVMYYMFRFTYANGDWAYSNYTTLNIK